MSKRTFKPSAISETLDEMEFRTLSSFGDGHVGVFWSEAGGPSPWEMHPDCDELLQVIEGEIEVEILPLEGGAAEVERVDAGAIIVVPRGCWHRQNILTRTKEMYLTLGRTHHSSDPDPRR